uniref:Uncharacterized protein n=1 Tax=Panagrellus redivivus TaxID=6233 RepID=A0A7E4US36_PANRE
MIDFGLPFAVLRHRMDLSHFTTTRYQSRSGILFGRGTRDRLVSGGSQSTENADKNRAEEHERSPTMPPQPRPPPQRSPNQGRRRADHHHATAETTPMKPRTTSDEASQASTPSNKKQPETRKTTNQIEDCNPLM